VHARERERERERERKQGAEKMETLSEEKARSGGGSGSLIAE